MSDLLEKIKDSANGDLILASCELVLAEEEYKIAKAKAKKARVEVMRSVEQCI